MKRLPVDEYLSLERELKIKYLRENIGCPNLEMIGKVGQIYETYCRIIEIRIVDSNNCYKRFIPFDNNEEMHRIIGLGSIGKELVSKGIEEGEVITFKFKLNSPGYETEGKYFIIEDNTIEKLENYEEYFKSLGHEEAEFKVLNAFSEDNNQNIKYFTQNLISVNKQIIRKINAEKNTLAEYEDKIAKLKDETADIDLKIQQKKLDIEKELAATYKEKEKQQEDLLHEAHEKYKKKLENEKLNLKKSIKDMQSKLDELKRYKLIAVDDEQDAAKKKENKAAKEDVYEIIRHIQGYLMLNSKKQLYYNENTIKSLYAGLKTEQLVILAGKPGSGKTSIVEGLAEAIDADMSLIPVQPNWMDKSDLLGFYNPIEKNYVSTPFLDILLKACKEAEKSSDKIFFICLDEMNLSHVEYYFSEFLSKLQTDRKIQLYSKNIYDDLKEEFEERYAKFKNDIDGMTIDEFLAEYKGESIENYFKLKKQYKMLERYPAEFVIPRNIKFLGTINKDETTKDLSPKVVDRCYLVKLEEGMSAAEKHNLFENFNKDKKEFTKKLAVCYEDLEAAKVDSKIRMQLETSIEKLKADFKEFNISLNNRFDKTVCELASGKSAFKTISEVLDLAIASLILPKVNFSDEDEYIENFKQFLYEECQNDKPISRQIVDWMCNTTNDQHSITYWS